MANGSKGVVTLRNGLTVPVVLLQVLWRLEGQGATLTADAEGVIVRPRSVVTDADRAVLRAYRDVARDVVAYCDTVV